jgi:serine/arginine repetitive matrix protein 2
MLHWLTDRPTQLGNVINGTGPIDDDDDDDDVPPMNVPPRMSMAMGMGMGMGMNASNNIPFPTGVNQQGQWGASGPAAFGSQLSNLSMQNLLNAGAGPGLAGGMDASAGMNMGMGMVDPRVFAVHQQAMMIAKQTYQLAVAQQAMRDAADEWERGSAMSGWTGGRSSASTPNMLNMGMGLNMNMNMGGGGGGMGGFPGAGGMWPNGGISGFPGNSARGMYSGYAASEVGGAGGAGSDGGGGSRNWTTSSVYGESFGAPRDRPSRAQRQSNIQKSSSPLGPGNGNGSGGSSLGVKREGARPRTRTAPSFGGNAAAQRASVAVASSAGGPGQGKKRGDGPPSGYGLVGAISPPSSWKGPPSQ